MADNDLAVTTNFRFGLQQMHSINEFPPEIVDDILLFIEQPVPASTYYPQFPLTPLLRVCRAWHPLVARRLYATVALGSALSSFANFYHADIDRLPKRDRPIAYLAMYNDPRCRTRGGEVFVRQFREALEGNAELGGLVRRLRLKGRIGREDEERVQDFVRILSMCPGVLSVEIQDCHYPAPMRAPLLAALAAYTGLEELVVRNADGAHAVHVLGTADFLCAAPAWPALRHLEVNVPRQPGAGGIDEDIPDISIIDPASLLPPPSLYLRTVVLPRARLRGQHLRFLHALSPGAGLTRLEAVVAADADTLDALGDCLRAWGPALRVLSLHFAAQPPPPAVILDALPVLRELEELALSSSSSSTSSTSSSTLSTSSASSRSASRDREHRESDAWTHIIRGFADALAEAEADGDQRQLQLQLPRIRRLAILLHKGQPPAAHLLGPALDPDPQLLVSEKRLDELCAPRAIRVIW